MAHVDLIDTPVYYYYNRFLRFSLISALFLKKDHMKCMAQKAHMKYPGYEFHITSVRLSVVLVR